MKFKNDMGRSMMEMILYLGLIVVLTASTLKMYADSVEKTRIVKLEEQIDDLKEYVNTYFLGRQLPTEWTTFRNAVGGEEKFADPWGGKVLIATGKIETTPGSAFAKPNFEIKYSGSSMDEKRCITVGNTFIGKGVFAVKVNNKILNGINLTISKIAENCGENTNTIEGIFYKE